jgi:hypothetical protein
MAAMRKLGSQDMAAIGGLECEKSTCIEVEEPTKGHGVTKSGKTIFRNFSVPRAVAYKVSFITTFHMPHFDIGVILNNGQ